MDGEPVGDAGERTPAADGSGAPGWSRGPSLALDLGVATVLYLTVTVGLLPWYSSRLFQRDAFRAYYDQGIYQPRILGPAVVLWLERTVLRGDPLGSHLVVNGRHPLAGGLYTALFLLNGIALVAIVLLARGVLRRANVADPGRSLLMVVLVVVLAASLSTVTPYDLPSIALILVVVVVAGSRPPWDLLAVPLVIVGVLTRESALVAIAALVAQAWVAGATRRRTFVVGWAAIAGVAAYFAVRLGSSPPAFWAALTVEGNVARLIHWIGLGLMAVLYLVWRSVCRLVGLDSPSQRRAVRWLWIFASPYVVTALLTGYWFETRLLVPMVVSEFWLRASVGLGQPCRPDLAKATSEGAQEGDR